MRGHVRPYWPSGLEKFLLAIALAVIVMLCFGFLIYADRPDTSPIVPADTVHHWFEKRPTEPPPWFLEERDA